MSPEQSTKATIGFLAQFVSTNLINPYSVKVNVVCYILDRQAEFLDLAFQDCVDKCVASISKAVAAATLKVGRMERG
jgi:hypothetical protein